MDGLTDFGPRAGIGHRGQRHQEAAGDQPQQPEEPEAQQHNSLLKAVSPDSPMLEEFGDFFGFEELPHRFYLAVNDQGRRHHDAV